MISDAEIQETIGNMYKNIHFLRSKEGLSIPQMAEIAGLSEKELLEAENCGRLEGLYGTHIKNICTHFKISADVLLYEKLY